MTAVGVADLQKLVAGIEEFTDLVGCGQLRSARELIERMPGFLAALILASKAQAKKAPKGVQKNHYRAMAEDLTLIRDKALKATHLMDVGKHLDALLIKSSLALVRALIDLQGYQDERLAGKEVSP